MFRHSLKIIQYHPPSISSNKKSNLKKSSVSLKMNLMENIVGITHFTLD